MNRNRISSFLIVVTVFAVFAALPAFAQKLEKIRFGSPNRGMSFFPIIVAQNKGFFRAEGLDAEIIVMIPTVATQALIARDLNFGTLISINNRAAMTGAPLRTVMELTNAPNHVMVVKPEIKSMEELRGNTLGISGPKSLVDVGTRMALDQYGIPHNTVKIVSVRASALRLAALKAGRIDASFLPIPYNKMAVQLGFKELMPLKDLIDTPSVGITTHLRTIQDQPGLIVRVLKATLKGLRLLKANKSAFLEVLTKESRIKDRKLANLIYADALKFYSKNGIASKAAMLKLIAHDKRTQGMTRKVSLSEVADFSFVQKASRN